MTEQRVARCIGCGTYNDQAEGIFIGFDKKYGKDQCTWALCLKCLDVCNQIYGAHLRGEI